MIQWNRWRNRARGRGWVLRPGPSRLPMPSAAMLECGLLCQRRAGVKRPFSCISSPLAASHPWPMNTSDQELLLEYAQRRDAEAFASLVARYQTLVFAASQRLLGNRDDAEEVTQEVFLSLATNAGKIAAPKVGGWLYRTAVNAAYSRLRTDRARRDRERLRATPDHEVDKAAEWRQIEEVLDVCLEELGDDERELIIQRFFIGRSQQELAADRGVDQSTISRRLTSAVDQLRRQVMRRGLGITVAALAGALAEHASAAAVPTGLTASLNKIGVAGLGADRVATSLLLRVHVWPTLGVSVAGLMIVAAALSGALSSRSTGPTATVATLARPLQSGTVAGLTRIDYSKQLSSSGLAIDRDGRVALCNDRPAERAGVYLLGNGVQRLQRLPEHRRRTLAIGPGSTVAVGYDRHVAMADDRRMRRLSDTGAVNAPLSVNASGVVAFIESEPVSRIRLAEGNVVRTAHEAGDRFAKFAEVSINDDGDLAFRATTADGAEGIFLSRQGEVTVVAEVGEKFTRFRPWFDFNNEGQIAVVAELVDGTEALFVGDDGGLEQVARSGLYFASILQASLNNGGAVAFTARTPDQPPDLPIAGLYYWDGSQVVELLPPGQSITGRSLQGVLLWRDCLNDAGQIAVVADFGPGADSAILRLETSQLQLAGAN